MILLFNMRPNVPFQRILFLLTILLIPLLTAAADTEETEQEKAVLFITSVPLNASMIIDGGPVLQQTPALFTGIEAGAHQIKIRKEGFEPVDLTVKLEAGTVEVLEAELYKDSFIINLPGSGPVYLRRNDEVRLPGAFRLPEGEFRFERENGGLYISPLYPKEDLLQFTGTMLLSSFLLTNAAVYNEIKQYGDLGLPHSRLLTIAEVSTLLLGLAEIALLTDKNNFINDMRIYKADLDALESEAENLYQQAQRAMTTGGLEDALSIYSRIISDFPDSRRFDDSLYKIAKIHIISGDTNLASSELKIIINKFPAPEIYDRSCQTLALLYFNAGDMESSIEYTEKMVYFDPLFSETRENIELYGVKQVIENWARNPERQTD